MFVKRILMPNRFGFNVYTRFGLQCEGAGVKQRPGGFVEAFGNDRGTLMPGSTAYNGK